MAGQAPSALRAAEPGVPGGVRVAVVGPTATGKSEFALDLIEVLGEQTRAEIVSADASQLYRGMDIGTAKLGPGQRRGVPHHQIDVLDVRQDASVAAYQVAARADLAGIASRGARGLIVGGSGLYVRAVTDALDFPGTDPDVRSSLAARARREGAGRLWEELRSRDPQAAERIEPHNTRRIVRALEVMTITGRPFTACLPAYEDLVATVHLALRPERAALNARIDRRAESMFDGGLVEETEALVGAGLCEGGTASRSIGYAQALAVLQGRMTAAEAVGATAAATRKLASRQIKWFRRDPRVQWLDVEVDPDGRWEPGDRRRAVRLAAQMVRRADEAHRGGRGEDDTAAFPHRGTGRTGPADGVI